MKNFSLKFIITISIIALLLSGCSKQDNNKTIDNDNSSYNNNLSNSSTMDNQILENQDNDKQNSNNSNTNNSLSSFVNNSSNSSVSSSSSGNSSSSQNPNNSNNNNVSQSNHNQNNQQISLSIDCINASNEKLYEKLGEKIVPKNGIILNETFTDFKQGQSAYDVLKSIARQNNIVLSTKGFGEQIYIAGINGLKEFDAGQNSGWLYTINGKLPDVGIGSYKLKSGDKIQLRYTVNFGDI